MRIGIILPFRCYGVHMQERVWRADPQIGICAYLKHLGHDVNCIILAEKNADIGWFLYGARMHIVPCRQRLPAGMSFICRAVDKTRKIRRALSAARTEDWDLTIVRCEDLYDVLTGLYIRRKYRIPLVFVLADPPGMGWEISKLERKASRLLYFPVMQAGTLIRRYAMRFAADLVLVTTRWFQEALIQNRVPASKLMPYPNGIDQDTFQPHGIDFRDLYGLKDKQVIIYSGIIARARKLEVLIRAFAAVNESQPNARLVMVGKGNDVANLARIAEEIGIGHDVIFTGEVHPSKVPGYIAAADIAVSAVPPLRCYIVSSPIKLFEYMAIGKPVVANVEIFEHREVLAESGAGILTPFNSEGFAAAILQLLEHPQTASDMGRKGYVWVRENRSYEILARRLEARLLGLVGQIRAGKGSSPDSLEAQFSR